MASRPPQFRFNEEQMRQWTAFYKAYPGWRKRWELVAEYARSRGGLTLDFWRLKVGPAFGESTFYSLEECAEALAVPVSELSKIWSDTKAWVQPRLEADPAWQLLRRRGIDDIQREIRLDPPSP